MDYSFRKMHDVGRNSGRNGALPLLDKRDENVCRLREQQERARQMLRGGVREMWGLEGEQSEE